MQNTYSFLSGDEPTEKQLHELMEDVLIDVKKRSEIASKRLQDIQLNEIKEAKNRFNNRLRSNELK